MQRLLELSRGGICLLLSLQLAVPAGIQVATAQSRDAQVENMRHKATLWVLAIGVSKYADRRIELEYADHDAVQITRVFSAQQGVMFREVFTKVLVDEQASREEILRAMSQFLGQASKEDVVLIFLAGHGVQERQSQTYYFASYNTLAEDPLHSGLPMPLFEEACRRIRKHAGALVLWLDTGPARTATPGASGVEWGVDLSAAVAEARGQYVLSASMAGEGSHRDEGFVLEESKQEHGPFAYSLLRGLKGEAADEKGVVWLSALFRHVNREVPRLTRGEQHPHGRLQGVDMPLSVLAPGTRQIEVGASTGAGDASVEKKGSKAWLWLLLIAAAAAGGAAVGLSGGSADEASPSPIPSPPEHPE